MSGQAAGKPASAARSVREILSADHEHLDAHLRGSGGSGSVNREEFDPFRAGLLRHIGMEEKLLLPVARSRGDADLAAAADRLTDDHCALATLLVPSPTPAILQEIRRRLTDHNHVEEGDDGVYATVDALLSAEERAALVEELATFPPARPAAYSDNERALARVKALLG